MVVGFRNCASHKLRRNPQLVYSPPLPTPPAGSRTDCDSFAVASRSTQLHSLQQKHPGHKAEALDLHSCEYTPYDRHTLFHHSTPCLRPRSTTSTIGHQGVSQPRWPRARGRRCKGPVWDPQHTRGLYLPARKRQHCGLLDRVPNFENTTRKQRRYTWPLPRSRRAPNHSIYSLSLLGYKCRLVYQADNASLLPCIESLGF